MTHHLAVGPSTSTSTSLSFPRFRVRLLSASSYDTKRILGSESQTQTQTPNDDSHQLFSAAQLNQDLASGGGAGGGGVPPDLNSHSHADVNFLLRRGCSDDPTKRRILWRPCRLCRYPQRIFLSATLPPYPMSDGEMPSQSWNITDISIGFLFVEYFVPGKFEVILRSQDKYYGDPSRAVREIVEETSVTGPARGKMERERKKKNRNRGFEYERNRHRIGTECQFVQQRVIEPSGAHDVAHWVNFPVSVSESTSGSLTWTIEILFFEPLGEAQVDMNCFMQVALKVLSVLPISKWKDDVRDLRLRQRAERMRREKEAGVRVALEEIEDEFERNYRRLDQFTKRKMVGLVRKKIELLKKEDFRGAEKLKVERLDRLVEIGVSLRSLEMTKRKALLRKRFREASDIQTEIYQMRKDVEAIVSGTIAARLREKAQILPMSIRNAKRIQRQCDAVRGVLNILEDGLESERDYFPREGTRKDSLASLYFDRIVKFGFGETISLDDSEVRNSMPTGVWFRRVAKLGFGFGAGPFGAVDDFSRRNLVNVIERPSTGMYFSGLSSVGLGEPQRVRTTESARYVRDVGQMGFGEERVRTTESQAYFRDLSAHGMGSRPGSTTGSSAGRE